MKSIAYVLIALLGIAVVAPTAGAQSTTAQISGTIKDQSGAVLPGVEVTVTQTATGAKRTAVSNETGNYVLASLPLGPYMLEAALPGFKSYVQSGIVLQVDASPTINIVLEVGQVTDQVEVQSNAALVENAQQWLGNGDGQPAGHRAATEWTQCHRTGFPCRLGKCRGQRLFELGTKLSHCDDFGGRRDRELDGI